MKNKIEELTDQLVNECERAFIIAKGEEDITLSFKGMGNEIASSVYTAIEQRSEIEQILLPVVAAFLVHHPEKRAKFMQLFSVINEKENKTKNS